MRKIRRRRMPSLYVSHFIDWVQRHKPEAIKKIIDHPNGDRTAVFHDEEERIALAEVYGKRIRTSTEDFLKGISPDVPAPPGTYPVRPREESEASRSWRSLPLAGLSFAEEDQWHRFAEIALQGILRHPDLYAYRPVAEGALERLVADAWEIACAMMAAKFYAQEDLHDMYVAAERALKEDKEKDSVEGALNNGVGSL
jgi:hypothetical protein